MRTKLMLLTPSLQGGGAERVMVNLLKHFDRERIEPVFMTPNFSGPYTKLLPKDVEVIDLGITRVRYMLPKLLKEVNKAKPDVILSTLEQLNLALLLAKPFIRRQTKLVIREANLPSKTLHAYSSYRKWIYHTMYRRLYSQADRIIAQSDMMRSELLAFTGVQESRVKTINNPIDIDAISQLTRGPNPFLGTSGKNIVSVGRLEYQKGYDLLIQAFKLVTLQHPNSNLYLLGEGSLRSELAQLAESLGIARNVHFAGFTENPYLYMKHADLFVLSSRYEGFPNVVLEALACSAKIVSVDCESGPRDILSRLEYGLLVPRENISALAEGMLRGLQDEQIGSNGFVRAMDYDCRKITELYEKVLIS
ncbi:glycosyltransferase involved in cell wall biosynthesis [Paenibacillus taihuensis]|uniref:Glycosyltransferase involved in cell wall biosynthesis n=1 Tax=Paenibacillus taihuensis TaxID=1156355 RepID=A0A3D9Q4D6_9BACL|nr:glycosyltransferase [Paenibacillus taihuensis]REE57514.1 glycosyltransferase involved in cell wall biosynthesis [Paenibacillus taihuensis]